MRFTFITFVIAALAGEALCGPTGTTDYRVEARAGTDGKACKTNLNQILNSGTCVNGKCQIQIPGNEIENVRSADC